MARAGQDNAKAVFTRLGQGQVDAHLRFEVDVAGRPTVEAFDANAASRDGSLGRYSKSGPILSDAGWIVIFHELTRLGLL
jgi:hypothetical protein